MGKCHLVNTNTDTNSNSNIYPNTGPNTGQSTDPNTNYFCCKNCLIIGCNYIFHNCRHIKVCLTQVYLIQVYLTQVCFAVMQVC